MAFPKQYTSSSGHVGYAHECAYMLAKGYPRAHHIISDVLSWRYSQNRLHPTQKPLTALMPLNEAFSKPGDFVLDPFSRKLKRNYIGIEIDPDHHAKAAARLSMLLE